MGKKSVTQKRKLDEEILNVNGENSCVSVESININNFSESSQLINEFHDNMREWALKYNVRTYCLRDLLKILTEIGVPFLPKDPTTFLRTPKLVAVEKIANGDLWYAGLQA